MLHNDEIFEEIRDRTDTFTDELLCELQDRFGIESGDISPEGMRAYDDALDTFANAIFSVFAEQYKCNR